MKNRKEQSRIVGTGSVDLETLVRDAVAEQLQKLTEEMAKKYFRDIVVDFTVTVK